LFVLKYFFSHRYIPAVFNHPIVLNRSALIVGKDDHVALNQKHRATTKTPMARQPFLSNPQV